MVEKIIVGRDKPDLAKFGDRGTVMIGKHIVGQGEQAHLTNPVFMDVIAPHTILVCGKRGTGKCVEENTLITLNDGRILPIKDIADEQSRVIGLGKDLKSTHLESTEFFKRKVKRLIHLRTRSGREIKLTPEHPLLTVNGWKEAHELGMGSRIATPRNINAFGNLEIDDYKVKILAYLLAEGHMRNHFVLFSNSDLAICRDFFDSVNSFDPSLVINRHSKDHCYRIVKDNRKSVTVKVERNNRGCFSKGTITKQIKSSLAQWLVDLGLYGKLSVEREMPEMVFQFNQNDLVIFLNRLFSCDGSIYSHKANKGKVWEISYSTSSEIFARQVQHLLLRFSILSRLRKKYVTCNGKRFKTYELVIGTDNAVRFVKEIGFFGEKEKRIAKLIAHYESKEHNPNVDTIPREIWDTYRPSNWAAIGRVMGYSLPKSIRTSIGYSPSRQKLAQIAKLDQNHVIQQIAESDIFWDEIVSMELLDGDFNVCDISVPELHNFVANDIYVHNSYSAGVIAEEMTLLPKDIKKNLSVLMIDTMGIYWSMKKSNDQDAELLDKWGLKPAPMDMQFFIPKGHVAEYEKAGVTFDYPFTLPCKDLSSSDWIVSFGFGAMDDYGLLTERVIKKLQKIGHPYSIQDIIAGIEDDSKATKKTKDALASRFMSADGWGIFEKQGTSIEKFFSPGKISVIDISHYVRTGLGWSVRSMVIGLFARKVFQARLMARKTEEVQTITGSTKKSIPMVWLMMDEAHQFVPSEGITAATEPVLTLVKEGREPGISVLFITQIPNKLHPDVLAQSDLVLAHRLTSESDIEALRSIMQSYARDDIMQYINELPKTKGAAVVLDDNSERIFPIQVRPRLSWHAGGSPKAIKEKTLFD